MKPTTPINRILSLALAALVLLGTSFLGPISVLGAETPDGEGLGASSGLGESTLGQSGLGMSAFSLLSANTITITVDGVQTVEAQVEALKTATDNAQKSSYTGVLVQVESGQSLVVTDTIPLRGLGADFPNLARLEIRFADVAGSEIPASAFYQSSWIKELESNAEKVDNRAFYGTDNLRTVRLPEALEIGEYAFQANSFNCEMPELYIPKCETLGQLAFTRRVGFAQITLDDPEWYTQLQAPFESGIDFYGTRLTTGGNSRTPTDQDHTRFSQRYSNYFFLSVDGVTYFHPSLDGWLPRTLGGYETGEAVNIPMKRGDGAEVAFTLTEGSLPPGLTLENNVISGSLTTTGTYQFKLSYTTTGGVNETFTWTCEIEVGGVDIVNPTVLEVRPGTNQMNVPTDGEITVIFDQPMNKTAGGTLELLWNNTLESMTLPRGSHSWNDAGDTLTVSYSSLTPGKLYWIYIRDFKSTNNMAMEEVNQYRNFYFTTAVTPEQPHVEEQVEWVDVGEPVLFRLTMGQGDQRADRAQIVNYDGLTFLEPASFNVTDDCDIRVVSNRAGIFSFRVNFYKDGGDGIPRVATSYLSVRGYYRIDVSADPQEWGTVTGAHGAAPSDKEHVVTAIPKEGYRFSHWSENGQTVSLNSSYYFTPKRDRDLTAHFTYLRDPYQVVVQAAPAEGGSASGTAQVWEGDSHTVTARPAYGYYFVNWVEFEEEVSREEDYTFTVTGDHFLTARFSRLPHAHMEVRAEPESGGVVTGTATLPVGTEHTVTATENPGYRFTGWTEAGEPVSDEPDYTFVLEEDRELVASFFRTQTDAGTIPRSSGSSSSGGGSSYRTPAKMQIPADAFSWDGDRTLTVKHDAVTVLGLGEVRWDDVPVQDFTVYSGSVIIRFDGDFIAAQSPGAHTVRVEFLRHWGETVVTLGETGTGDSPGGVQNPNMGGDDALNGENDNPATGGAAASRRGRSQNVAATLLVALLPVGVVGCRGRLWSVSHR